MIRRQNELGEIDVSNNVYTYIAGRDVYKRQGS